jgi:dienelactone hydrolase
MRWLARIAAIVAVVLVALVWIVPAVLTKGPMSGALPALESSATVDVDVGSHVTFTPADGNGTGVIIYPGGFVDPRSYAPAARRLAEAGSLVVIVEMPLGLAVLGPNRADSVIEDHPEIDHWVIAGHSLGGTMAARYAADHPESVDGLILWAAYPENSVDLADWTGETATVFGTRDGLTTIDDIEQSRDHLPPDTAFVSIEGGNHAQFGWYGDQRGDHPATISRPEQQRAIVNATAAVLNDLAVVGD